MRNHRYISHTWKTPYIFTTLQGLCDSIHSVPRYVLGRQHLNIAELYSDFRLVSFSKSKCGSSRTAGNFHIQHGPRSPLHLPNAAYKSQEVSFSIREAALDFRKHSLVGPHVLSGVGSPPPMPKFVKWTISLAPACLWRTGPADTTACESLIQ